MQKTRKKRKMMGDFIQPKQRQKHSLDFQFSSEVIPRRNNNKKKKEKKERKSRNASITKKMREIKSKKRGMRKREIRNRTFFFSFCCVCVCII